MFQYQTSLQERTPFTTAQHQQAIGDMRRSSPYKGFGRNHQDVLNVLGEREAGTLNREVMKANVDYTLAQQQAQRDLALSGLTQLAQARQNDISLENQRLQNTVGFASDLLRGLFN